MKNIEEINQANVKKISAEKKLPEFYTGDIVKVGVRITEGKRDRIQYFEGVCIAKKNRDINSSFTVRKISFGEGVESLDNEYVKITGYMLTLAPDAGVFVLSQNPYADCFFCGYGGPESAIELTLKPGYDDFYMDELVEVVGILRLKREDVSSGVYLMDDAVAIRK